MAGQGVEVFGAEPALVGLGAKLSGNEVTLERAAQGVGHLRGRTFGDPPHGDGIEVQSLSSPF